MSRRLVSRKRTVERQDRHLSIGRCARKRRTELVGRPRNRVDRRGVQSVLLDAHPALAIRAIFVLPDEHLAVVGCTRKDSTK